MSEKQASSEIAKSRERFEKFAKDEFDDSLPFDWNEELGEYSMAHPTVEAMWRTFLAAERDTRERIAQLVKLEDLNWDYRDIDPGEAVSIFADNVAERIRGKE
jgi:hypothetical protein